MKSYKIIIVQSKSVPKVNVSKENVRKESALLVIVPHAGATLMDVWLQGVSPDLVLQERARLVLVIWARVRLGVRKGHVRVDTVLGLNAVGTSTMGLDAKAQNVLLLDVIHPAMAAVVPRLSALVVNVLRLSV